MTGNDWMSKVNISNSYETVYFLFQAIIYYRNNNSDFNGLKENHFLRF